MGLLIPEVFTILLTDSAALLLLLYVSPSVLKITKSWDINNFASEQFVLDKKRHLISTIVTYVFTLKIPLFLFYIYTNDKLSNVLTGAMCAAGAINATTFGSALVIVKIANIFLMCGWLAMNRCSNNYENLPHTKKIYGFLMVIILTILLETVLSFANFASIDPTEVVSCCSSIYSATLDEGFSIMSIQPFTAFYIFTGVTIALLLSLFVARKLIIVFTSAFLLTAVLNLIVFTSTYVYELPTHRCPYCILQKEYSYIGYLFYISLFLAIKKCIDIYIKYAFTKILPKQSLYKCLFFIIFFYFISSIFPIKYYLINGVWLQ